MAAKHACRALANLHMGWAAIVCPFDSDSHNTDEWQREMSSSASGAPEAMISEIVAAHTGAGRSAGREDRENNRSCDNGISTKGAGSGAGAGAGAGHKVDCPVRTGSESAKSEEDSDAAAAAEYMPFHTGRVPDQLRKALLRSGSWHRMAGDARRAWVAILDSWTLWHGMNLAHVFPSAIQSKHCGRLTSSFAVPVHYLTKLGSLKEQVAIQLCLRRDGVLLAHGADAEGPFVLAGTFRPPSHTSAQVRQQHGCESGDTYNSRSFNRCPSLFPSDIWNLVPKGGDRMNWSDWQAPCGSTPLLTVRRQTLLLLPGLTVLVCASYRTCWPHCVLTISFRRCLGYLGGNSYSDDPFQASTWGSVPHVPRLCWLQTTRRGHQTAVVITRCLYYQLFNPDSTKAKHTSSHPLRMC